MSFWGNINTAEIDGSFESGGSLDPIPAGTVLRAAIVDIKFDMYDGEKYINAQWNVLAPEEFRNRKVFQKIKVFDQDVKKAERAKMMLAAIAQNAGGGLLQVADPDDRDLTHHLTNKLMLIKVEVWEMNGKSGNWVSQVAPDSAGATQQQPQAQQPQQQASQMAAADSFDNDIPF